MEFKFNLNQVIFYMRDNKVHSAPVLSRMQVENLHEDFAATKEQQYFYMPFGPASVFYSTCHGVVRESDASPSKEELLSALRG